MRRMWGAAACAVVAAFTLAGCLAVGPPGPYRNGQTVDLSVTGFAPYALVHLSECAPAERPSAATGCAPTLAGQPIVRMDRTGGGAARFTVASVEDGAACDGYCSIVATDGRRVQQVPISFSARGQFVVGNAFDHQQFQLYDHEHLVGSFGPGTTPAGSVVPGVIALRFLSSPVGSTRPSDFTVNARVNAGQATAVVLYPRPGQGVGAAVTDFPPTPPANSVRVRYVNVTPVTLRVQLGRRHGPDLAPGQSTTITLAAAAGIPNGDDYYSVEYGPKTSTGSCGRGDAGGIFYRGHSYVITVGAQQPGTNGPGSCPYGLNVVISSIYQPAR